MAHAFDAEYSRTGMVSRYERSSTGWCTFVCSLGDKPGKSYVRNVIVVFLDEDGARLTRLEALQDRSNPRTI